MKKNLNINVSSEKSSECESPTAPKRGDGSKDTLETMVSGLRDGMKCTPNPTYSRTLSISGTKAIVVIKETGNE